MTLLADLNAQEKITRLFGWRIWFDNCGSEPRFHPGPEKDLPEDLNAARPWTEEDEQELAEWQAFEAEQIANL